jgi:hypothetical protein
MHIWHEPNIFLLTLLFNSAMPISGLACGFACVISVIMVDAKGYAGYSHARQLEY